MEILELECDVDDIILLTHTLPTLQAVTAQGR